MTYENLISEEHLYESTQGGSFNPGFLLLESRGSTDLERRLVRLHERRHATLCNSVLGRRINFLQFVLVDSFALSAVTSELAEFQRSLDTAIRSALIDWAPLHEGVATRGDRSWLSKIGTEESSHLLDLLERALDDRSLYREGLEMVDLVARHVNHDSVAPLHLFGNLDAAFDPSSMKILLSGRDVSSALSSFVDGVLSIPGGEFSRVLEARNWELVSELLSAFGHFTTDTPDLANEFLDCCLEMQDSRLCPGFYKERLLDLYHEFGAQREHRPVNQIAFVVEEGKLNDKEILQGTVHPLIEVALDELKALRKLSAKMRSGLALNPEEVDHNGQQSYLSFLQILFPRSNREP